MARYIDADALIRAIRLYANRTSLGQICPPDLSYSEMLDIIADAPTADVEPRAEVAMEIFWEMDMLLMSITIDEKTEESFVGFDFDKYLALRRKYTKAEPPRGEV